MPPSKPRFGPPSREEFGCRAEHKPGNPKSHTMKSPHRPVLPAAAILPGPGERPVWHRPPPVARQTFDRYTAHRPSAHLPQITTGGGPFPLRLLRHHNLLPVAPSEAVATFLLKMIKVIPSPAANTAETHRKIWARPPSTTGSSARRCNSTRVPILMGTTLSLRGPSLGELLVIISFQVSLTAPSDSRRSGLHGTRAAITAHTKQSAANTLRAIFIQTLRLCLPTPSRKSARFSPFWRNSWFEIPIRSVQSKIDIRNSKIS